MSIHPTNRASRRRGFALVELTAVVLIVTLAILLASVLLPEARRRARLAGSIQNLQQIGKAAGAFAADNDNRVYSLNWTPGRRTCGDYQFPASTLYYEAAADQAVCILRTRAGRTDIQAIRLWFPHYIYNHLVLVDYLDGGLPSPMLVSPGDAPRLAWVRSLADGPDAIADLPCAGGSGNAIRRWPYSSSYEMQSSFYSPDALRILPGGATVPTVAQSSMGHRFWEAGTAQTVLGGRRMDEVQFPSHKAFVFESYDRFHGSREAFFMYPEARIPVLFPEGSVSVRSMEAANTGFHPNTPGSVASTRILYSPELTWEPPTLNGGAAELGYGRLRWTRSGLRGRDFQGPEVPWTP